MKKLSSQVRADQGGLHFAAGFRPKVMGPRGLIGGAALRRHTPAVYLMRRSQLGS